MDAGIAVRILHGSDNSSTELETGTDGKFPLFRKPPIVIGQTSLVKQTQKAFRLSLGFQTKTRQSAIRTGSVFGRMHVLDADTLNYTKHEK